MIKQLIEKKTAIFATHTKDDSKLKRSVITS